MWFQIEGPPGWYPSLLRQWSFLFHRSMEEWSTSKDLTREKCSSSSFILRPRIIACPPSPSTLLVQLISQVLNFAILARQCFAGFYIFAFSWIGKYERRASNFAIQVPSCNFLTVHNLSFFVHICNVFYCNWINKLVQRFYWSIGTKMKPIESCAPVKLK